MSEKQESSDKKEKKTVKKRSKKRLNMSKNNRKFRKIPKY